MTEKFTLLLNMRLPKRILLAKESNMATNNIYLHKYITKSLPAVGFAASRD